MAAKKICLERLAHKFPARFHDARSDHERRMASDTFYVLDLRGSTKFLFAHS